MSIAMASLNDEDPPKNKAIIPHYAEVIRSDVYPGTIILSVKDCTGDGYRIYLTAEQVRQISEATDKLLK